MSDHRVVSHLLLLVLTLALSPPAAAPLPGLEGPRAPAGYEPFCFPIQFEFEPETSSITSPSSERLAAILDYTFRDAEWFHLGVSVPRLEENAGLARQRAEAVIRVLSRHGIRADRIQVRVFEQDYPGAGFSRMIPPDDVARVRAAEARGVRFC